MGVWTYKLAILIGHVLRISRSVFGRIYYHKTRIGQRIQKKTGEEREFKAFIALTCVIETEN